MSFKIYCDVENEAGIKCNQETSPRVNKNTGELHCGCNKGKRLKNQDCITSFAKSNLIALGQIYNVDNSQKPYATKCTECEFVDSPVINKKAGTLKCSSCNKELTGLTPFFRKLLLTK